MGFGARNACFTRSASGHVFIREGKGHWNIGQCLVMLVILFNGSNIHAAFINA